MSDKIEVKVKIRASAYKKLESQIQFLKKLNLSELGNLKTVEDLIAFYLDHISFSPRQFDDAVNAKLEEMFNTLNKKGLSLQSIAEVFSADIVTPELEAMAEEDEDDDLDDEEFIKPKAEKKS